MEKTPASVSMEEAGGDDVNAGEPRERSELRGELFSGFCRGLWKLRPEVRPGPARRPTQKKGKAPWRCR